METDTNKTETKTDTTPPTGKVEVVQVEKGSFETLVQIQLDTKKMVEDNRDKISKFDGSAEKVEELDRMMKDFDETMRKFREDNAGMRILGGGMIERKFNNPMDALLTTIPEKDHPIKQWQIKSDMVYLGLIMEKTPGISWLSEDLKAKGGFKACNFYKQFQVETKAMYDATAVGTEFIPTILSSELFMEVRLALRVSALHTHFPMTSKNVEIPGATGAIYSELIPEATSDSSDKITAKTPGTRKTAFALKKLGLRVLTSGELEEDSIIPTLQHIRGEIIYALSTGEEYALINGDTTSGASEMDTTDQNGDAIHSKSNLRMARGYRRIVRDIGQGLILSSGGTLTASHTRRMWASMGKYAADITRLAWVTGVRGVFSQFMALGNIQTLDKIGPQAVVLTGQVAQHMGAPVILSEWVREDVGLSGYSGGSAGTNSTSILCIHRPAIRVGEGRSVKIESEKDIDTDQIKVVGTRRLDFKNMYATASDKRIVSEIKGLTG